jgi:hypothetical protein
MPPTSGGSGSLFLDSIKRQPPTKEEEFGEDFGEMEQQQPKPLTLEQLKLRGYFLILYYISQYIRVFNISQMKKKRTTKINF